MELGLNFDLLLHQMLNTLCTCVLPLDLAIHIAFIFIIDGQKTLFRICHALLKLSKNFIVGLQTKKDIMGQLRHFFLDLKIEDLLKTAYVDI